MPIHAESNFRMVPKMVRPSDMTYLGHFASCLLAYLLTCLTTGNKLGQCTAYSWKPPSFTTSTSTSSILRENDWFVEIHYAVLYYLFVDMT